MSQENAEIALAAFRAYNSGDMSALHDLYDPSAVMRGFGLEPGPFFGRDAIFRAFERYRDAFETDSLDLISAPRAIGDRVVMHFSWHIVGRGPELKEEGALIYTVRGGRIREVELFREHRGAIEAAGLSD